MPSLPTKSAETLENSTLSPSWKIKLLYDGECPLCLREHNFLQKQDAGRGLVAFVDIAAENYTPEENGGISFAAAMGRIHAVLADGTILQNVEVFRQVYDILGIGWIYAATKWPVIGFLVDIIYEIWASWRLTLTGRPNLTTILAERQKRLECNASNRCSQSVKIS
ncbi:MAG: thiol-disulfide oxidoreductase DCC family protein [Microcystis panniformis]